MKLREERCILMIHIRTQEGFLPKREDPTEEKDEKHRRYRHQERNPIVPPVFRCLPSLRRFPAIY